MKRTVSTVGQRKLIISNLLFVFPIFYVRSISQPIIRSGIIPIMIIRAIGAAIRNSIPMINDPTKSVAKTGNSATPIPARAKMAGTKRGHVSKMMINFHNPPMGRIASTMSQRKLMISNVMLPKFLPTFYTSFTGLLL